MQRFRRTATELANLATGSSSSTRRFVRHHWRGLPSLKEKRQSPQPRFAARLGEGRLWVTGCKTPSEYVLRITPGSGHCQECVSLCALGSEQFHARLWANNATRLSGMEWLWSAKRA